MNNVNVNKLDSSGKKSMQKRIITASILIILAGCSVAVGGLLWFAFISLALLFATYEFVRVTGKKYRWYVYVICYVCTLTFYGWGLIKNNVIEMANNNPFSLERYNGELCFSLVVAVVTLFATFLIAILHENFDFKDATYLFTMCFLVGVGFQSFLFLRFYPEHCAYLGNGYNLADLDSGSFIYFKSTLLIVFVVLCTCLNDAMAYFVGVFFGKHKINPRISPKKTIEGFYGGWILSSLLTFIIFIILCALGYSLLPGILDVKHWYWILLLCIVIPLLGNLGDFSFSLIKRNFGSKDYGWIIVGHGGILDRADSLIFTSIGMSVLLTCIEAGWSII